MTFKKSKQQFTKEEIIEILKRNVNLFKDEDEFVDYIVELALYLVEHRMQTQTAASDIQKKSQQSDSVFEKREEPFQKGSFGPSDVELHNLLRRHSRGQEGQVTMCRVCGASVPEGNKLCPICGSLV
jgi:rubrerythrin